MGDIGDSRRERTGPGRGNSPVAEISILYPLSKNAQLLLLFFTALALMMHGWGDMQGFFCHPARAGLVAVLTLSTLALLFIPFELFAGGAQEIHRQRAATFLALASIVGLCWLLPYAERRKILIWPQPDILTYIGVACVSIGMSVRIAGMKQLGRFFSGFVAVQPEHRLMTDGSYRWVRHPIYTGSLLALAGFFLVYRSMLIMLVVPLYALGTLWRIADEERLLAEAFGEEYEAYRARTWRLIPFVY
jgi:protein-S-isoprenylcysteine O-methyltransferase Ste14